MKLPISGLLSTRPPPEQSNPNQGHNSSEITSEEGPDFRQSPQTSLQQLCRITGLGGTEFNTTVRNELRQGLGEEFSQRCIIPCVSIEIPPASVVYDIASSVREEIPIGQQQVDARFDI